ncbi:MAG: type II secretion system protein [Vampirovibrionia bacterium]
MNNKGFTLIELLIVIVILGILALISSAVMLNAIHKAKDGSVKANICAASSSLLTAMTIEERTPSEAINIKIVELNNMDGIEDSGDEAKSPYNKELDAFVSGTTGDKGQVALDGESN